jgi:hypothetical protein
MPASPEHPSDLAVVYPIEIRWQGSGPTSALHVPDMSLICRVSPDFTNVLLSDESITLSEVISCPNNVCFGLGQIGCDRFRFVPECTRTQSIRSRAQPTEAPFAVKLTSPRGSLRFVAASAPEPALYHTI